MLLGFHLLDILDPKVCNTLRLLGIALVVEGFSEDNKLLLRDLSLEDRDQELHLV